jgi:hypothetical protein
MSDKSEETSKKSAQGSRSPLVTAAILVAIALLGILTYSVFKSDSDTPSSNSSNNSTKSSVADHPIPGAQGVYLSPQSANHANGSTFTVQVRENSSQTPVNAVQVNLTYPVGMLKLVKVDTGPSKFKVQAQSQAANGQIQLARGSTAALTGDQLVVQITFQAVGPGSAKLAFADGTALIVPTTTKNLVTSLPEPAVFTIQ